MVAINTDITYKLIPGKIKSKSSSKILVPEAEKALNSLKHSVASDLGIDFTIADKGQFSTKDCGRVGGEMVKRLINQMKQEMAAPSSNKWKQ